MSVEWLSGLIDGEGCFSIHVAERNHHGHHLSFQARFVTSMRSGDWSDTATCILKEHEILFHSRERKRQTTIATEGWRQTQKLCKILLPHLVVKRSLIQRLIDYKPALNNKFPTRQVVIERASLLDFVRKFNKGKNRRSKWSGTMIMEFYGYDHEYSAKGLEETGV